MVTITICLPSTIQYPLRCDSVFHRRLRVTLLISALLGTLFVAPVNALPAKVQSVAAPFENLYKSTGGNFANEVPQPKAFSIDKQSQFIINFNKI